VKKTVTSATLSAGDGVENYYIDRDQIAFVTDGSGNRTFHYLYGLNVDAVMAQDSSTGMLWSLADRLGSIDTLTDKDGNVVNKRSFDSFGRVLSETNPSVSFRYGYTGRERDLESGLDYYRARYYDPNVGRFISVDPMGFGAGDTNLYRYVGNNSTNANDPTGMWLNFAIGAGIGFALDLGFQLIENKGDIWKTDPTRLAISTISGAIGGGIGGALTKGGFLLKGTALADKGLGLAARTAINAGVGFNLGYYGQVAKNGIEGKDLTEGAFSTGIAGGAGAAVGELAQAGIGKATSVIKDWRLDSSLKPLRKEFGTNINWGFEGNNITVKEAKLLVKNIGENPISNGLLREVNNSATGYKLNVKFNTKTAREIGKVVKLGEEAGDLFGIISYQTENGLVKSTKPIDIAIYWDAIKNKSAGVLNPVHFATSKVSHELTHVTDIFRTGRRVNHLSDEWMAYQNEKLSLNYYEGISSLKIEDYGHIARQVGVYRNLPTYIDDLGEALDEMF
jgi:RHS repeat-associated protein